MISNLILISMTTYFEGKKCERIASFKKKNYIIRAEPTLGEKITSREEADFHFCSQ